MGPYQPEQYFTASISKQIIEATRNGTRSIKVGNLDIRRDFLDVRDVASAYETVMNVGEPGMAYNICSGEGLLLSDIVTLLPATFRDAVIRHAVIRDQGEGTIKLKKLGGVFVLNYHDFLAVRNEYSAFLITCRF